MKNKLPLILLSLLISLGLWLYVVTYISPEDERTFYDIPIVMVNESSLESHGLMLVSSTTKVDLRIHGSRADLNALSSGNIVLTVDLSNIREAGTHSFTATVSYPDGIATSDLQILSRNPQKVTVVVGEYDEKEIPLNIEYTGTLPEGYTIDRSGVIISHSQITVSGPREDVEKIEDAVITVNCDGATESINASLRYTLRDANKNPVDASRITTNVEEVQVQIPVEHMKALALRVDVEPGGGATQDNVSIELSQQTIMVAGSQEELEALGDELVIGTVKLESIVASTQQSFTVKLPSNVRNISNITEVTADITLSGLRTVYVPVPDDYFTFLNVPDGLVPETVTKQLNIAVRGPEELVQNITANDLTVTIDLANTIQGTISLSATVTLKNGDKLGIMDKDKYFVDVRLTVPTPDVPEE